MNISHPQIPKELSRIDDFSSYAQDFLIEESPISEIQYIEGRIKSESFFKIEIQKSIFKNCTFNNCSFENASFFDVIFESSDLSNCKFAGAYFERCRFVSCKCVGMDMGETVIKQTSFENSNLQYSNANKTKMTDVSFEHVDFSESSMAEAKLKRFVATNSKFIKNNFFKTMLETVDFTENDLAAPIVSNPPIELKGAVVNMLQAANLIGLLGVVVKQ